MTDELRSLRGRAAYWEKRIELEKKVLRKRQLEIFAWAELARLVIRQGMAAYHPHGATFAKVVQDQFRIAEQAQRISDATASQFGGAIRPTGSRKKKLKKPRARAVRGGR